MNNPKPILGIFQVPGKTPLNPVFTGVGKVQHGGGKFSTTMAYPASSQSGSWGFMLIHQSKSRSGHPSGCSGGSSQWVESTDCVKKLENIPIQTKRDQPVVILPLLHLRNWGYCSRRSFVSEQLWNRWARYLFHHNRGIDERRDRPGILSISPYVNG